MLTGVHEDDEEALALVICIANNEICGPIKLDVQNLPLGVVNDHTPEFCSSAYTPIDNEVKVMKKSVNTYEQRTPTHMTHRNM